MSVRDRARRCVTFDTYSLGIGMLAGILIAYDAYDALRWLS